MPDVSKPLPADDPRSFLIVGRFHSGVEMQLDLAAELISLCCASVVDRAT